VRPVSQLRFPFVSIRGVALYLPGGNGVQKSYSQLRQSHRRDWRCTAAYPPSILGCPSARNLVVEPALASPPESGGRPTEATRADRGSLGPEIMRTNVSARRGVFPYMKEYYFWGARCDSICKKTAFKIERGDRLLYISREGRLPAIPSFNARQFVLFFGMGDGRSGSFPSVFCIP